MVIDLVETYAKAEVAVEQGDRRTAGMLLHSILRVEFTHPGAWKLLYKMYGEGKPLAEFQRNFARKYYPEQAYLLDRQSEGAPSSGTHGTGPFKRKLAIFENEAKAEQSETSKPNSPTINRSIGAITGPLGKVAEFCPNCSARNLNRSESCLRCGTSLKLIANNQDDSSREEPSAKPANRSASAPRDTGPFTQLPPELMQELKNFAPPAELVRNNAPPDLPMQNKSLRDASQEKSTIPQQPFTEKNEVEGLVNDFNLRKPGPSDSGRGTADEELNNAASRHSPQAGFPIWKIILPWVVLSLVGIIFFTEKIVANMRISARDVVIISALFGFISLILGFGLIGGRGRIERIIGWIFLGVWMVVIAAAGYIIIQFHLLA